MTQELVYTSAARGLKPGSRGFCIVMTTAGMAKNLADRLEALSGYRHLFPPNDSQAQLNPVVFSHLRVNLGGTYLHVLSRISAAGLDYTQRSNKLAHHVVLEANECIAAGPAALLLAPAFMETTWEGEPRILPTGRALPGITANAGVCRQWHQVSNDAGWAGVLAETTTGSIPRNAIVIFRPGMNTLALVAEALALLPTPMRWQVTFSTYYTKLPPELECQWRFVVFDSPEAKALERTPNAVVIDLCHSLGRAPDGPLVDAARTGVVPKAAVPQVESGGPTPVQRSPRQSRPTPGAAAVRKRPPSSPNDLDAFLSAEGSPLFISKEGVGAQRRFWLPVVVTAVALTAVIAVGVIVTLKIIAPPELPEQVIADLRAIKAADGEKAAKKRDDEERVAADRAAVEQRKVDEQNEAAKKKVAQEAAEREDRAKADAKKDNATPPTQVATESKSNRSVPAISGPLDRSVAMPFVIGTYSPPSAFHTPKPLTHEIPFAVEGLKEVRLFGADAALDEGRVFKIAETQRSGDYQNFSVKIASKDRATKSGESLPVATFSIGSDLTFKWESNISGETQGRANQLCNCLLLLRSGAHDCLIPLRENESLQPIAIPLMEAPSKQQGLACLKDVPPRFKLRLEINDLPFPWDDYVARSRPAKEGPSIELSTDSNEFMPRFVIAVDRDERALNAHCDWPLIRNVSKGRQQQLEDLRGEWRGLDGKIKELNEKRRLPSEDKAAKEIDESLKQKTKQIVIVERKVAALEACQRRNAPKIPYKVVMDVIDGTETASVVIASAGISN